MEMQQLNLYSSRAAKAASPHLRLVQPLEATGILPLVGDLAGRRRKRVLESPQSSVTQRREAMKRAGYARGLRGIAPEHVERFLNKLQGEELLVGGLSYDLAVRLSQLRFLRIRDVNLAGRVIFFSDGQRAIPDALFDDLRDHVSQKMCGEGADEVRGDPSARRDQLLFSHEAFERVLKVCASMLSSAQEVVVANQDVDRDFWDGAELREDNRGEIRGVRDNFLRAMGWFHSKRAAKRDSARRSPLGLFDKGPRIVRRDRGGSVHSYYLWRAIYSR